MAKEALNLKETLKAISKKYGENVVKIGCDDLTVDGILSLGSPSADFCLYGGIPEGRIIEFSGAEGSGKAQPLWSPVFTPNGYKKMGDIKVGDTLIDGAGAITKVIGVYERGKLPIYKVTFNDKTSTYCAGDHLWKVYNHSHGSKPKVEVISTDELRCRNLHAGCWSYSVDVPIIDVWNDINIDIDPYLLGCLIGDGSLHGNKGIANQEKDIIDKINRKLINYNYELVNYSGDSLNYSIRHHKHIQNNQFSDLSQDLFYKLHNYGLLVKSTKKFIPENYLYSSVNTRLELLRGIYDTDGYTDKTGKMNISTSSERLKDNIEFLARSLGCRVSTRLIKNPKYRYKGEIRTGRDTWSIDIKTPEGIIIATSKKHLKRLEVNNHLPVTSKWWRSIVSIDYVKDEECRCIMVDSPEHTYLTDDFICTHNTTNAFLVAASYQREELKRNPDNPRAIVLLDNEGTADPVWAKVLGYDMSDGAAVPTVVLRPEGQSAEDIFDIALDMLKTGEVGLLIFDSIATLVPQQIVDESMEKQQMGGIAKALTRFANTAIGLLRKYKATLIAINQVRENISGYGDPLTTPGGRAWKHACSSRIMFKRGSFFDEDGNTLMKKDAQSPAGHIIELYVLKTKTCRWDRKLGYMHLNYTKGIDVLEDTLDVATHFGFIDDSVQGSFTVLDPETGEVMLDSEGKPVKIRGRKNLKPYFEEHKDLWKKLYDKCYEKLSQKEDPNIVAFEEMLNIDLSEKLGIDVNSTNLEEI